MFKTFYVINVSSSRNASWLQSMMLPTASSSIDGSNKDRRPTSVIDERNDVSGSVSVLSVAGDEDSVYLNSDITFDDTDTTHEDDLDLSTNSRTLIWPHHKSTNALWKSPKDNRNDDVISDDIIGDDETLTEFSVSTMIPTINSFDSSEVTNVRTNDLVGASNWADKRFGHAHTNEFHNHINGAFSRSTNNSNNTVDCLESISNVDMRLSDNPVPTG